MAEIVRLERTTGFILHLISSQASYQLEYISMAETAGFEPAAGCFIPDTFLAGRLLITSSDTFPWKKRWEAFLENLPTSLVELNHNLESAS